MAPRTQEQFEQIRTDRKEQIMDAALHVFAEEGYHAASISKIALRADMSKGLMYNYFESKEDLLRAVLIEMFEKVVALMELNPDDKLSDELLEDQIHRTFEVVASDRRAWKLYFSMVAQEEVMQISQQVLMPKAMPYAKAQIDYFASKGHEDPVAWMRYFNSTMDGAKMQYLFDPDNFPMEKVRDYIIEQFIR